MTWRRILCWIGRHDWRTQYRDRPYYVEYHNRDGSKSHGFGPENLGDQCKRCGKKRPPFGWHSYT